MRCGTKEAIEKLARALKLPYDQTMQDWSYEVTNAGDIEKYIEQYTITPGEDEKFVLMEMIIQATNDQPHEELFLKYWYRIEEFLKADLSIHEYTIFYWACFDRENLSGTWIITPHMRKFWDDHFGARPFILLNK